MNQTLIFYLFKINHSKTALFLSFLFDKKTAKEQALKKQSFLNGPNE
jgi:hypothetical protein